MGYHPVFKVPAKPVIFHTHEELLKLYSRPRLRPVLATLAKL